MTWQDGTGPKESNDETGSFLLSLLQNCRTAFGQILPFAWNAPGTGRGQAHGQHSAVARGGNLVELPVNRDERQNSHPKGPGGARR